MPQMKGPNQPRVSAPKMPKQQAPMAPKGPKQSRVDFGDQKRVAPTYRWK